MNCAACGSLGFFRATSRVVVMALSTSARLYSYSTCSEGRIGGCALMASFSFAIALSYCCSCQASEVAGGSGRAAVFGLGFGLPLVTFGGVLISSGGGTGLGPGCGLG